MKRRGNLLGLSLTSEKMGIAVVYDAVACEGVVGLRVSLVALSSTLGLIEEMTMGGDPDDEPGEDVCSHDPNLEGESAGGSSCSTDR